MANTDRSKDEQRSREITRSRQGSQVATHRGHEPFAFSPGEFF